jgi:Nuclear protein Es2
MQLEKVAVGPPKAINIAATRIDGDGGAEEAAVAAAAAAAAGGGDNGGVVGAGPVPAQAGGVGGYGYVAAPSLADATPIMTWGEVASTPLRIEEVEAELGLAGPAAAEAAAM